MTHRAKVVIVGMQEIFHFFVQQKYHKVGIAVAAAIDPVDPVVAVLAVIGKS